MVNVLLLLLVVDGGVGTLDTVYHFASKEVKKPIVVVHDSACAATAIYEHCTHGDASELEPDFKNARAIDQLERIRSANEESQVRLLTFVASHEDPTSCMLDAILKLMITSEQGALVAKWQCEHDRQQHAAAEARAADGCAVGPR